MISNDQCTGCGNCIACCPKDLLYLSEDINIRGVPYVMMKQSQICLHCGKCEIMCTAGAIHIDKQNEVSGYKLIDQDAIPPHAGCYLGSLTKALADVIIELHLEKQIVIFKKRTADVNLKVETFDYTDETYYEDALAYKKIHPSRIVLIICSSSKQASTQSNKERFLQLRQESITVINTLNWFEQEPGIEGVSRGGSHMLEDVKQLAYASFLARGSVKTPNDILQLQAYIKQAIRKQMAHRPFAIVEMIFPCFYRLANRPKTWMPYAQITSINLWFETYVANEYITGILHQEELC